MNTKNRAFHRIGFISILSIFILFFGMMPEKAKAVDSWDFNYTGNYQTFTATTAGEYQLEVWGAQGGGNIGGKGGYSKGKITLLANETVYVYVGQGSANGLYSGFSWNGGGGSDGQGGAGGGATDVRKINGSWNDTNSLNSRLIVAGGGGGGGSSAFPSSGGAGGGTTGISGINNPNYTYGGGQGGTQTSAGTSNMSWHYADGGFGFGARTNSGGTAGGGGGGGFYGGGHGVVSGGGGGSSYIGGVTEGQTLVGIVAMPAPSSGSQFGQSGHGYARITLVAPAVTYNLSPSDLTKGTVTILIGSNQAQAQRIQLPNGNWVNASSASYVVSENGNYSFKVQGFNGSITDITVPVRNIYKDLVLNATPQPAKNSVDLNWNDPFGISTSYMIYRKNEKGEFESIPAKHQVRVLNIYPDNMNGYVTITNSGLSGGQIDLDGKRVADSGILKTWLLRENIDDVLIDTVSLSSFNANPDKYLKKNENGWTYDTVFYGMWNLRPTKVYPYDNAIDHLRSFINDGGGFMTSHHTMGYDGLDRGVNKLAKEMGVEIFSNQPYASCPTYSAVDANGNFFPHTSFQLLENVRCEYSSYWPTGNTIEITKKGLLTEFPFKVGDIGQRYTIPLQHGLNIFGKGDVWMKTANPTGYSGLAFKEITVSPRTGETGTNNFYVHTYNNTAIINSGHSFPNISQAEVRIIANTLNYLSQTTVERSWTDRTGMDVVAPTKPAVSVINATTSTMTMELDSTDRGTTSEYMIKAKNRSFEVDSNVEKVTLTTGLKGYSYVVDNNPSTIPDNVIDTAYRNIDVPRKQSFYVHVLAIDYAGNVSEVEHYKYSDFTPPTLVITPSTTAWTKDDVILTAVATDASGVQRIQLPNGVWVTAPTVTYHVSQNGTYTFYAEDIVGNVGSSSITISNIDKTPPPAPTINAPADWTKDIPVNVTILSGTDTQSGIAYTEYKLEGVTNSGWTTYSTPISLSTEGVTKIIARNVDRVGHVSVETRKEVKIDLSKPYNEDIKVQLKP